MSNGIPSFDPEMHRELLKVSEEAWQLSVQPTALTWEQYCNLMLRLCFALSKSFDHGLEEAIRYLGTKSQDPQVASAAKEIALVAKKFTEFLNFERGVLRQFEVRPDTIEGMMKALESVREHFKADLPELDADELVANLKRLRQSACDIGNKMEDRLNILKESYKEGRFVFRCFGAGIIAADLSILAATLGVSTVPSAASATFGGLMLTGQSWMEPPENKRIKKKKR